MSCSLISRSGAPSVRPVARYTSKPGPARRASLSRLLSDAHAFEVCADGCPSVTNTFGMYPSSAATNTPCWTRKFRATLGKDATCRAAFGRPEAHSTRSVYVCQHRSRSPADRRTSEDVAEVEADLC